MTENQTKEMFNLLTKCVSGIQKLDESLTSVKDDVAVLKDDVAVLKDDVAELKIGQKRIEKEVRLNTSAINEIAAEQFRLKIRVDEIENAAA